MKTSDFHYELPSELIAQHPLPDRTQARMMVLDRSSGSIEHSLVSDLPGRLKANDLLVVNNTRVIPARLFGRREKTGGRVEILLVEEAGDNRWQALVRARRMPDSGEVLSLAGGLVRARTGERLRGGRFILNLEHDRPLLEILEKQGTAPLPPYIKRPRPDAGSFDASVSASDRNRYQTVYARVPGAIAAPTAGLHLSRALLHKLSATGVRRTAITLHVGPGTFTPVRTELAENHTMEAERYIIAPSAARAIGKTRRDGGRVVAVGTTVVRTLETVVSEHGTIVPARGRTSLFIVPPHRFKAVDAMLTNFHLPESTLIMMVSAFAGMELARRAYAQAVRERYRFYSYGDCMLIL